MRKNLVISLGALLVLVLGVGLAFASDSTPTKEPETSPFFEATLQQAVDELDGKARPAAPGLPRSAGPQQAYYTDDEQIWPECTQGHTSDPIRWPWCHYTSDPARWPDMCQDPWPTKDYTWDHNLWPNACDPEITQDPANWWCEPEFTRDLAIPQCSPTYTNDTTAGPLWCDPLYTLDSIRWPQCLEGQYTYGTAWLECSQYPFTSDPYLWSECHYTSDSLKWEDCVEPQPTWDYTSSPMWAECPGPGYTENSQNWPWCNYTSDDLICDTYTNDPGKWPWCGASYYTADPKDWPACQYTSDPNKWEVCSETYPTKDYTLDANLWTDCDSYTSDAGHFMCDPEYTHNTIEWPWCAANWTWDSAIWPECQPGYTNSTAQWAECDASRHYTSNPDVWDQCAYQTADPGIWPECHYTSDPGLAACDGTWFPTKDYTTDTNLWPRDCAKAPPGDLGDAPDRSNHFALPGGNMEAYPGVDAKFPVVFDPVTGFPQGPKHWMPRADAWLGPTVTVEFDADLLPDQDTITNIDPPSDTSDRDVADDGVNFPVAAPHCDRTWFTYTLTIPPGTAAKDRYVNVWFDWKQDGDWDDILWCTPPSEGPTPEWAVQNQLIPGGFPPGTYIFATPPYLSWFPIVPQFDEVWMRISIAEQPATQVAGAAIADGRGPTGGYEYGETEDYYFEPVCPEPVADFYWDPPTICPNTTIQFWDNSTSQLAIQSWAWDFGDSSGTSILQNPTYSYGATGTYNVSFTVRTACGPHTITKKLTVADCTTQDKDHDIYIKDSNTDDGSVPSSSPWWTSPDIWVRNNLADDCAVETTHQNPVPGTQNKVCIRVRNRMATTVDDITVNAYYANAALGLTWPGDFGYLGNLYIASLAGGAETIGSVLWDTPYSVGHFCLLARADSPDDPVGTGPDTSAPVDLVPNNNNIAQKNTNLVGDPSTIECGLISTAVHTDIVFFDAVNTKTTAVKADIVFDSDDFPLGAGTLAIDPGGCGPPFSPSSFPHTLADCTIAPDATVRMTMTIVTESNRSFAISVVELIDDKEIGGIEYIREVPNCLYLPVILKKSKA